MPKFASMALVATVLSTMSLGAYPQQATAVNSSVSDTFMTPLSDEFSFQKCLLWERKSLQQCAIMQYLMSPERNQRFQELAQKAGPVIYTGLATGLFGSVAKFRISTGPFPPYPTGKQEIQTFGENFLENNHTSIVVWVNFDGSIDYDNDKSFTRLSVTEKALDPNTEMLLVAPDDDNPYWTVYSTSGPGTTGNALVKPHEKMLGGDDDTDLTLATTYAVPITLEDHKRLDDIAVDTIERCITDWTGQNWEE